MSILASRSVARYHSRSPFSAQLHSRSAAMQQQAPDRWQPKRRPQPAQLHTHTSSMTQVSMLVNGATTAAVVDMRAQGASNSGLLADPIAAAPPVSRKVPAFVADVDARDASLPAATLPSNHAVRYAATREACESLAEELFASLQLQLDGRDARNSTSTAVAASSLAAACSCPVAVGFDVEWKPNFVAGRGPNPVAVMQITTASVSYLFQLQPWAETERAKWKRANPVLQAKNETDTSEAKVETSEAPNVVDGTVEEMAASVTPSLPHFVLGSTLCSVLLDPRVIKVGVGINGDIAKMLTDYGVRIAGGLDLSHYVNALAEHATVVAGASSSPPMSHGESAVAGRVGQHTTWLARLPKRQWSLAALTETVLRLKLAKPSRVRMSDWEKPLSAAQQSYAALDAWVSFALFEQLHRHYVDHQACHRGLDAALGRKKPTTRGEVEAIEVAVRAGSPKNAAETAKVATSPSVLGTRLGSNNPEEPDNSPDYDDTFLR